MVVRSYTDARNNLKACMDEANDDRVPILITRRNGGNAVLVSESEWNSMEETLHLFSSRANALDLLQSMVEMEAGDTIEFVPDLRVAAE